VHGSCVTVERQALILVGHGESLASAADVTFKDRSRSSTMALFDISHMISCQSSVVTMSLSRKYATV